MTRSDNLKKAMAKLNIRPKILNRGQTKYGQAQTKRARPNSHRTRGKGNGALAKLIMTEAKSKSARNNFNRAIARLHGANAKPDGWKPHTASKKRQYVLARGVNDPDTPRKLRTVAYMSRGSSANFYTARTDAAGQCHKTGQG